MNFRDISIKSFKSNFRKYFAYFLCSSFTITVFFLYLTINHNEKLLEVNRSIESSMKVALVGIGIFSVFFINYAHSAFVRSRKKEFGLLLSLGMTKKDIGKMILNDNTIIAIFSLTLGLLTGTVFSRLFFMVVTGILGQKDIPFVLSSKSYITTLFVFISIFAAVIFLSRLVTNRTSIIELLKTNRKHQDSLLDSPFFGFLGVVFIISAFFIFYLYGRDFLPLDEEKVVLISIFLSFTGLYFVISQLGNILIRLYSKKRYYNKLLNVTEISYKFKQYKRIIYTITILSTVAVYYIGSVYSVYAQTLDTAIEKNPFHIAYVENSMLIPDGKGDFYEYKISSEDLKQAEKPNLKEKISVDFINMSMVDYDMVLRNIAIISIDSYNIAAKKNTILEKGHSIVIFQDSGWDKTTHKNMGDRIILKGNMRSDYRGDDTSYRYTVDDAFYASIINYEAIGTRLVVLSNEDFYELYGNAHNRSVIHLLNYDDWRKTEETVNNLLKVIDKINPSLKEVYPNSSSNDPNMTVSLINPKVTSRIQSFNSLQQDNAFYFFIMSFVGLLFFVSSGSVLYLKLFTELDQEKEKFRKLFRIGITAKEMKKYIRDELKKIFFIPLILGSLTGLLYILVVAIDMSQTKEILPNALIVVLFYFIFQTIFYLITKLKHFRELIR